MRKLILLTAFLWPLSATAHTCILNQQQQQTLQAALHIGNKVGIGKQLAAVAFQESSLGVEPDSPGHFGVGSIGYAAWQIVIHAHPWLQHYFHHHNWPPRLLVVSRLIRAWRISAFHVAGQTAFSRAVAVPEDSEVKMTANTLPYFGNCAPGTSGLVIVLSGGSQKRGCKPYSLSY